MASADISLRPGLPAQRVLIVEDLASDFLLLERHLQRQGLGQLARHASSMAEVEQAVHQTAWDVVLTDHQMPGIDFDAMLSLLRARLPDVPVILVSGTIGEELAVDLLHKGVADFVFKDRLGRLGPAIQRCLDEVQRKRSAAAGALALAESEAFNRTLVGSLGDGLFVAQDHRFVFANPALPAVLGYAHEDFVGLPFAAVVAAESLALWEERFALRIQPHLPEPERHYDVAFRHRHGEVVWMELRAARFVYRGQPAVLGVLRDTTERRRFIAELEQHRHHLEALVDERTRKAEAANRAKSAFLANVSHEIRTPLNAITGMVHLLQREIADPTHRQRLKTVEDAAHHLLSLVNDVLDLSKIESGKLTLELIDFDLDVLLARTCGLVEAKAHEKGLRFEVDNQAACAHLRGDPTRLSQLMLNLLSNAIKFTQHGGVTLHCALLESDDERATLQVTVTDTGIGIDAERLGQLFSAFEQADSSTTRRFGGTGLGLAISRHLAEQMGGQIRASSLPGQGSAFQFEVRLQRAMVPVAGTVSAPGPSQPGTVVNEARLRERFAGRRVLLAEDNEVNQLVAHGLLTAAGLEVDMVSNGLQAVAQAEQGGYSLILMDVQMPELDGLQAARILRRRSQLQQVPILAMTANAFAEDRVACLAAGMNDHIAKPVVPERLYELLLHWLSVAESSGPREAPEGQGGRA